MTNGIWDDAMRRIAAGEDVHQVCDHVSLQKTERVRDFLREEGREDLLTEMDANLRDNRLGLTRARAVWHSISQAQRRVLVLLALGACRELVPASGSRTRYGLQGGGMDAIRDTCGIGTVRALHSRSLIEPCADNVFRYALTEHARFVLKLGQPAETRS